MVLSDAFPLTANVEIEDEFSVALIKKCLGSARQPANKESYVADCHSD